MFNTNHVSTLVRKLTCLAPMGRNSPVRPISEQYTAECKTATWLYI